MSDTVAAVVPRAAADCRPSTGFMTDTCPLGAVGSAKTIELVQQLLTGATITVSQQTVSRTGSQHTVSRTGSQQTVSRTGSQQTGSQQTGSQQAALRW